MAWFSNKFLWEALIVVALILDWSSIGEASGTLFAPLHAEYIACTAIL